MLDFCSGVVGNTYCLSVVGRICALNIADKKTSIKSVPFFWTALFGKSLRYTGKEKCRFVVHEML